MERNCVSAKSVSELVRREWAAKAKQAATAHKHQMKKRRALDVREDSQVSLCKMLMVARRREL